MWQDMEVAWCCKNKCTCNEKTSVLIPPLSMKFGVHAVGAMGILICLLSMRLMAALESISAGIEKNS